MLQCGLLGRKLGHSYSKEIHGFLSDYSYEMMEKEPEELKAFFQEKNFDGINVTIPYKKDVIPFCDELSDCAKGVGSVNTIVHRKDGRLYGDNTDVYGFLQAISHAKMAMANKKVLVLGSGGASVSVCYALRSIQAIPIVISRTGENNYQNLEKHSDASFIVNATPVGMYPNIGERILCLDSFSQLEGVFDLIYNPEKTDLLLQAEALHIPFENGLYMLVAQAKKSAELFSGTAIADSEIDRIYQYLKKLHYNE